MNIKERLGNFFGKSFGVNDDKARTASPQKSEKTFNFAGSRHIFNRDAVENNGYRYTQLGSLSSRIANENLTRRTLEAMDFREKKVLDIGCGDGTYARELSDRGQTAFIEGLDVAEDAIKIAQENIGRRHMCFYFYDKFPLPFKDKEFDIAHLRGILHHADNPFAILSEAVRVAKEVIILEPNGYNPGLKLLERFSPYHRAHQEKSFTLRTFARWVKDMGAEVVSFRYIGLVPFFCPDFLVGFLKKLQPLVERNFFLRRFCCATCLLIVRRQGKIRLPERNDGATMDVLFINPGMKKETQHPLMKSLVFSSLPMGLGYVAGYLRAQNKIVLKILDEVAQPLSDQDLEKELSVYPGRLMVGLSCLTATFERSVDLAKKIKAIKPGTVILFGGPHPSALPEESLATGVVDMVVRGEGEIAVKEVYDALNAGGDYRNIRGVSYMREGKFQHNPMGEIVDLKQLPPFPYDLLEQYFESYSDVGLVLSSRGCPYDCIYCSNRIVTGKKYRTFPIPYVMDQVELLVRKYKQRSINFVDDNLVVDRQRFFDLTNALIERGLHKEAYFTSQCRADAMDDEVMAQLKRANFKMLGCGIETSSNRLMKILRKNELVEDIQKGVEITHHHGILAMGTFIFGLPTETRVERRDSIRFSQRLPLDSCRFNIATPYPGTPLYEIAKKENRLYVAPGWKNFNVQYYLFGDDIPYVPATAGKYTLIFDVMWANLIFYLRWKTLKTIIFKTDNTGGGVLSFQKRRKLLKTYLTLAWLAFFIFCRFAYVGIRAMFEKEGK